MKKLLIVLGMTLLLTSLACGPSESEHQILKQEVENLERSLTELNAEINLLKWATVTLSDIIGPDSLSKADLNDSLNKAYVVNRGYVDNSISAAYAEINYLEAEIEDLESMVCALMAWQRGTDGGNYSNSGQYMRLHSSASQYSSVSEWTDQYWEDVCYQRGGWSLD
jgi:hypothetical protein